MRPKLMIPFAWLCMTAPVFAFDGDDDLVALDLLDEEAAPEVGKEATPRGKTRVAANANLIENLDDDPD